MEAYGPYVAGQRGTLAAQRIHLLLYAGFQVIIAQLGILLREFERGLAPGKLQGDGGIVAFCLVPARGKIDGDDLAFILKLSGEGKKRQSDEAGRADKN